MKSNFSKLYKSNQSFIIFIVLMLVFRSAVADWNDVPTGSMKPTIIEGDRLLINKMAYDIRIPFTHISLAKLADPQRNDIVIFDSVIADKKLVKRVIAVPGDLVSMDDNKLMINGKNANYAQLPESSNILEKIGKFSRRILTTGTASDLSSFPTVKVPNGHYLVLGDNRNNSADSRVIGFVPRNEIVGRTSSVLMSLDYDNFYLPRSNRFLHTL